MHRAPVVGIGILVSTPSGVVETTRQVECIMGRARFPAVDFELVALDWRDNKSSHTWGRR